MRAVRIQLPLITLLCLLPAAGKTQENPILLYGDHFEFNSARLLPGRLGLDRSPFQISFLSLHFWLANNSLTANNIFGRHTTSRIIDDAIGRMGPAGELMAGQDFLWLSVAATIKHRKKGDVLGKPVLSFTAGVTEQLAVGFRFSKNFMELAWHGNKQFEGKTIDLHPLALNALYNREYFFGFAFPVVLMENLQLRLGARLKYLQGISSIHMPASNEGTFTTADEGREVKVTLNMDIFLSGIKDDFNPLNFSGRGMGADIGMTVIATQRAYLHFALLDIGNIRFSDNTRQISNDDTVTYRGLIFSGLFGGDIESEVDSLSTILNSDVQDDISFSMPLSKRIIIQLEYRTPMITREGRAYNTNSFFFTYVQGLADMPRSTTRSYFSFAYGRNFGSVFNIGANIGAGGISKFTLGAFASVRAASFKLGIGAGNITGLLMKSKASGVDLTFQLAFSFK